MDTTGLSPAKTRDYTSICFSARRFGDLLVFVTGLQLVRPGPEEWQWFFRDEDLVSSVDRLIFKSSLKCNSSSSYDGKSPIPILFNMYRHRDPIISQRFPMELRCIFNFKKIRIYFIYNIFLILLSWVNSRCMSTFP